MSPIPVREQRIAQTRGILGYKRQHDRGDQVDQGAAGDHRTTDVVNVLQLLFSNDGSALRKALHMLHVKRYHCSTERFQSLFGVAGAPAKVCNLVPQVVQACQACRKWKRFGDSNEFACNFEEMFNEEVQFDLSFYRSLLQPRLGGEK